MAAEALDLDCGLLASMPSVADAHKAVKRAYRKSVFRNHPDRTGSDNYQKVVKSNKAKELLLSVEDLKLFEIASSFHGENAVIASIYAMLDRHYKGII